MMKCQLYPDKERGEKEGYIFTPGEFVFVDQYKLRVFKVVRNLDKKGDMPMYKLRGIGQPVMQKNMTKNMHINYLGD